MRPRHVDSEWTLEALERLVATDSVNPFFPYASGEPGRGEREIARLGREMLEGMGMETTVLETTPGRPSVVGVLRGSGGGRSLMLNGHIDTVGPGRMESPFEPRTESGRMYGRGTYDMKGGVAACLGAAHAIATGSGRLEGDLVVALVADEEDRSLGTQEVLEHYRADGAIVAEPTDMGLCLAHKGFLWLEVTTHGVAYHGSDYSRGVDANLGMVSALGPVAELQGQLLKGRAHPLLGPMSLHLGVLEGGDGPSIYAERCRGQIELRTIPGPARDEVLVAISAIIERARERRPDRQIDLEHKLERPAFEAMPQSDVALTLGAASAEATGAEPSIVGVPFWTDAAFLRAAGIDTVVFGPTGAGPHADEEWVELDSVVACSDAFAQTALSYCRS